MDVSAVRSGLSTSGRVRAATAEVLYSGEVAGLSEIEASVTRFPGSGAGAAARAA
ncbi:hypothetical protein [Glutamicibacter nicotianae]|uniref:hypothetical protein n=1 Tax=Glutamicibacter nicotianae TaxID=37929 RepID=UPI00167F4D3D|nr:hypothetical protein [Glutamicibacter nicotianae]